MTQTARTTKAQTASPIALRVAGLLVHVRPLYGDLAALCQDYLVPYRDGEPCDLAISTTPADIARERELACEGTWTCAYLETLHVLRAIAEAAPARRALLMHGAAIAHGGRAYLFCAPSGTGKSTHLRLWRSLLGADATVINGDKPLITLDTSGAPTVHGTPWAGKEGWQANTNAPLAGICFVERAGTAPRTMRRLSAAEALDRVMASVYLPSDPAAALLTLGLTDELLAHTPLWLMHADISLDAARMSFEALTGTSAPQPPPTTSQEEQL